MSASIILPILFGAIFLGKPYITIFVIIIGMIAVYEFTKLIKISHFIIKFFLIFLLPIILMMFEFIQDNGFLVNNIFLIIALVSSIYILSFKLGLNSQVKLSFYGLTGLIYIAGSLLSGLYIWENYQNTLMIIIMIGIFISDTSAYIIGTQIGKHALAKNISPNKTIEGSIGSFIFTIIFFIMIYGQNISIFTNINTTILFAINLNISAQIGDIIISTLKRKANVKNTGVIMPGHGGCLDRIDSVLLSLLTTHLFLWSIL